MVTQETPPTVWGKPAICDDNLSSLDIALGFTKWRCPECNARMTENSGGTGYLCLNGCQLTAPDFQRMQDGLRQAFANADARKSEGTERDDDDELWRRLDDERAFEYDTKGSDDY